MDLDRRDIWKTFFNTGVANWKVNNELTCIDALCLHSKKSDTAIQDRKWNRTFWALKLVSENQLAFANKLAYLASWAYSDSTYKNKTCILTLNEKYFLACSFLIFSPRSFTCSAVSSPRRLGCDWNGACFTSTFGTVTTSSIAIFDMSEAELLLLPPSAPWAAIKDGEEDLFSCVLRSFNELPSAITINTV